MVPCTLVSSGAEVPDNLCRLDNAKSGQSAGEIESSIKQELSGNRQEARTKMRTNWDVFISHAGEDKKPFVTRLASALERRDLAVWFDKCVLTVGDSLREKIDEGLSHSKFGVVVLSPSFFAKDWPRIELDGLLSRERYGQKVILPIWHRLTRNEVLRFSPILASRLAIESSRGIAVVADEIKRAVMVGTRPAIIASDQSNKTDGPGHDATLGTSDVLRPIDLASDDDNLGKIYRIDQ